MMKKIAYLIPVFALFSCTAHHMTTADKAYDRMAYSRATCSYEKALRNSDDREAALRAADAYDRQNKLEKAADWYAFAERIAPLDAEQAAQYGSILMSLERLEKATGQFENAIALDPENSVVKDLLKACRDRQMFFQDTTLFSVRPVELEGMSGAFSATPYKNGILFAGEKSPGTQAANPWNGLSYLDLYSAGRTPTGTWSIPEPVPGDVNGRFHDGPAVLSADGRTMYFTRSNYYKFRLNKDGSSVSHLKLFRAELDDEGKWGNIHQFAYNSEDHSTGHAALSSDGNTLYFVSDRPGGLGGTDIYKSILTAEGWSEPKGLGPVLNTPGNEMFPTLHGDTLYFSSNGHAGIGGMDIFKTWQENGQWKIPANMNFPLNTPFDDLSLIFEKDGRSGFLSSDRRGSDQIYSFTMNDPTLIVRGICMDEFTREPLAGVEVKMLDLTTGEVIVTMITGDDGSFEFDLTPGQEVRVQGQKHPMFIVSEDISTKGQRTSKVYEVELKLKAVEMDKPILVNNIYYDYDKWDIRPEAAVELMKIARLFMDNPELSFELSSHTDSRASDMYNLVLSEARARSAVDFLIRKGVDPRRIAAKGYGESRLVNHCSDGVPCSEDEHQQNRRTEFKVVKSDVVMQ